MNNQQIAVKQSMKWEEKCKFQTYKISEVKGNDTLNDHTAINWSKYLQEQVCFSDLRLEVTRNFVWL